MSHLDAIKRVLTDVLHLPNADSIRPETRLFDDLNLDSTSSVDLLIGLEDEISNFEVDPESMKPEDFATVGSLDRFISSQVLADQ